MIANANAGLRTDINGLRGISVLLVVLFHFNIGIFDGGFIGVDFFFVISGFLMTKIISSRISIGKFNYIDFVARRAQRIFPALFVLIAVLFILGVAVLPPLDLTALGTQIQQSVIFNSNNYFSSQNGYFSTDSDDRWLLHTWSLSVEWQFYMLYPIFLWTFFSIDKFFAARSSFKISYVLLLITFFASMAYCVFGENKNSFFSVFARSWQMIAGGLVYLSPQCQTGSRTAKAASYAGLAVLLASVYATKIFGLESAWPGYYAIIPVAAVCTILWAAYEGNVFISNPLLQRLGSWSYSIYLWHWPIVVALTITGLMTGPSKMVKLAGITLSIMIGYLSYRWIEPAGYFKRINTYKTISYAVAATAILSISSDFVVADGLLMRVKNPGLYRQIQLAKLPYTYEPACENIGPSNDKFCLLNKDILGKKVLVLGDSHAGHLLPWFQKHSQVNTTFFVKSGCPVVRGLNRAGKDRFCISFSEKAFGLAESGKYDTVIISQNWTSLTSDSDGICTYESGKCVGLRMSKNPEIATEAMAAEIRLLTLKKIKVVVLDATPWFYFNVPNKVSRDYFWSDTVLNNYPVVEFYEKNKKWDALFGALAREENFFLISLRPELCKKNGCAIFDQDLGIPIYIDKDHFNPMWIAQRGNAFLPFVQASAPL
jgi:peptidoglycan/LPS O-acetylase OafA/YrhL